MLRFVTSITSQLCLFIKRAEQYALFFPYDTSTPQTFSISSYLSVSSFTTCNASFFCNSITGRYAELSSETVSKYKLKGHKTILMVRNVRLVRFKNNLLSMGNVTLSIYPIVADLG